MGKNGLYARYFKRPLDIIAVGIALIVFGWLFILVAVLVRIKLGSPILFTQDRPGKDGKIFKMYKFRTMLPPQLKDGTIITDSKRLELIKANSQDLLPDEQRLPRVGLLLRRYSLDELPELINVLKGDMSLIGPRPLVPIYLPYYTEEEMHRHDVRPGLTGLAQVHGRNTASWELRFTYDLQYVRSVSLWTDLKIILDSVRVVLEHKDIGEGAERPEAFNVVRQRQRDLKIKQ